MLMAMSTQRERIAADLRHRIETGEYRPGDRLPTYEELAAHYGTGHATIQAALRILRTEGLISVRKKAGITVRERPPVHLVQRGTTVQRDRHGYLFPGWAPDKPWQTHGRPRVSVEEIPARPAELLDVDQGTPVVRRRRITSPVGEPPFQIADTWIHPTAVEDAPRTAERDTGPGGYLDRIEEAGHGPLSWTEHTRTRMPTIEEARLLGMADAMPVLEIARVGTSARTNAPVEVTICIIPGDRVELVTRLRRAPSARWRDRPAHHDGS